MTYAEALQYLYANLPMFQRVGASAYKKDLSNTLALCEIFDNPHQKLKFIHVAGTNGKGSTSHMLASVLQSAGYKTGLYTSPHLKEFTERIKVNGAEVNHDFVVSFVEKVKPHIDIIKPSFFEITVVMAFEYFVQQQVDIAVIEVGMGGRLDSTNVIIPEVSVITNISYDHMDLLGDSLLKIAFEKAGIIKEHVPVVISERQGEVSGVFETTALAKGSPVAFAQDQFLVRRQVDGQNVDILSKGEILLGDVHFPLHGDYQLKNLPGVMKALEILNRKGYRITDQHIRHGLEHVLAQTGLKGRWQQLNRRPLIICDTGHNAEGIRAIVTQINSYAYDNLHMVIGMVKDKDRLAVLKLLPKSASYYFCHPKIPRALDADLLKTEAEAFGLKGKVIADVNDAIAEAKSVAGPSDFIFVGGSTFVVAEIEGL
jgi:dihydrofolate synthase/folylpolyglutamate synthase